MKTKYLALGGLAFLFPTTQAQSESEEEQIDKSTIEVVYNHYIQDGNNSAVTGGIGTEELSVYGSSFSLTKQKTKYDFSFQLGTDIISSASTDNIDYVVSSVSSVDGRYYTNATYKRKFKSSDLVAYGGGGISVESDYVSISSKIGLTKTNQSQTRTYNLDFEMFNDDLRWGRRLGEWDKLTLIYPFELRNREWYDVYKRNSYNLKFGLTQILNKRNILGFFPILTYQEGLLATPFHRIYFKDDSKGVEQLPQERLKAILGIQLNSFVGGQIILKNLLNLYRDNFGIEAFTIDHETLVKLNPALTISGNLRFYAQKGTIYFKPYGQHEPDAEFYTSDYDLADFQTYNVGLGLKYRPSNYKAKRLLFNLINFKYTYLNRTNGLAAHIFSLALNLERKKVDDRGRGGEKLK